MHKIIYLYSVIINSCYHPFRSADSLKTHLVGRDIIPRNTVGIQIGDTKDDEGFDRFFPILFNSLANELMQAPKDRNCCSEYAISFHDLSAEELYGLEYCRNSNLSIYTITVQFSTAPPPSWTKAAGAHFEM